jgi:hypothetical protein
MIGMRSCAVPSFLIHDSAQIHFVSRYVGSNSDVMYACLSYRVLDGGQIL